MATKLSSSSSSSNSGNKEYYRKDGVRITHDPYAPEMREKYGAPGSTVAEGFDPYADTVGAGIYGGAVERDGTNGEVRVGRQFQNHNPRPGPVFSGQGGYAPIIDRLQRGSHEEAEALLRKYPDLANDVTTGGATPLHMCGMSGTMENMTELLLSYGADAEAVDTYGFTPLHRMCSNNLAHGAKVLLERGGVQVDDQALRIAQESRANKVLQVLHNNVTSTVSSQPLQRAKLVRVVNPNDTTHIVDDVGSVYGTYRKRTTSTHGVPSAFALVCEKEGWDTDVTWNKLAGNGKAEASDPVYWERSSDADDEQNGTHCDDHRPFIYYNHGDRKWWIDGSDGLGVFIQAGSPERLPALGWDKMREGYGEPCAIPSYTRNPTILVL